MCKCQARRRGRGDEDVAEQLLLQLHTTTHAKAGKVEESQPHRTINPAAGCLLYYRIESERAGMPVAEAGAAAVAEKGKQCNEAERREG